MFALYSNFVKMLQFCRAHAGDGYRATWCQPFHKHLASNFIKNNYRYTLKNSYFYSKILFW